MAHKNKAQTVCLDIFKWAKPGLFLLIFVLFNNNFIENL